MRRSSNFLLASLTLTALLTVSASAARNDFDGDGKSDLATYDSLTGSWDVRWSSDDQFHVSQFGFAYTLPVTGDFDGDGKTDFGCYDPATGNWSFQKSTDGFATAQFGYPGTLPLAGDFDGDGKDDFGCYADDTGDWFFMMTSNGFSHTQFGYDGTLPVVGDFDGDGKSDYGCYEPLSGRWFFMTTANGFYTTQFGFDGTLPAVGDFDGDGKDDFACATTMVSTSSPNWFIMNSSVGFISTIWSASLNYTVPVTGDFDGDNFDDYGNFSEHNGLFHIRMSTGDALDVPFGPNWYPIGTTPLPPMGEHPVVLSGLDLDISPYWYADLGELGALYMSFHDIGTFEVTRVGPNGTTGPAHGTYRYSGNKVVARSPGEGGVGPVKLIGKFAPYTINGAVSYGGTWTPVQMIPATMIYP